jgi:tetratricopeptide (TPR) repeat protein
MDSTITKTVQEALELIRAGRKPEAHALLLPIIKQNPNAAQAWYLFGFTITDPAQKLYCFQQVLRIDPSHQASQKLVDQLTLTTDARPVEAQSFFATPPSFVSIPATTPIAMEKQPSKTRLLVLIGIAIAVLGVIAVIGVAALYISNGRDLNKKVDALFSQHQCSEVVQYVSFEKSFPRNMFSSSFSVYHQIEECQAQLALEDALKSEDWPAAYTTVENYLVVFPSGAFAADMDDEAGNILLAWSKNLLAQNDYKTAIDKLTLAQRGFPTSSAIPVAKKTMFDDYLLWGKYSFEQKDYQNAEKVLKLVGWDEQASPEQVQQANQGLAVVYLEWGKAQVAAGQFDEGQQLYENAKTLNPGLADYDRLKDQITLSKVAALAKADDFDGALAMVKNVSDTTLSEESKADADAEQATILDAYAHSSSVQAKNQMTTAAANLCQKQPPTTPLFAVDAETIRFAVVAPWTISLPDGWMATTPAELHYVLCIEQSQTRVETCYYTGGHTLQRYRYNWLITLYNIATGKVYKTTTLPGSQPRNCGAREGFYSGAVGQVFGAMPSIQQVVDWLTKLKIVK